MLVALGIGVGAVAVPGDIFVVWVCRVCRGLWWIDWFVAV